MAVRRSGVGSDGSGMYPYAEIDFDHNGEQYTIRITAIPPYRDAQDRLQCHIDYHRVSDGKAGRYENVRLPAKIAADNGQRRHSMLRLFRTRRGQGVSVPSPVFP